jgi:multidrug efflux pump subunit AcrA (membrane-fusion protein)
MVLERLEETCREQEYEDLLAGMEAERSRALLELEQARLDLDKARADLEACRLVAPVSGTIMRLEFRPGDLLERGIRLTTIVRDADLKFTAYVDDEDMAFMRTGLPVEVSMDAFPHRKYGIFGGRVEAVAPGADYGGSIPLFRVTVALEEKGKAVCLDEREAQVFLRPGQKGRARIILREAMPVWSLLFDKASAHL